MPVTQAILNANHPDVDLSPVLTEFKDLLAYFDATVMYM